MSLTTILNKHDATASGTGLKLNLLSESSRRLLTSEPVTEKDIVDLRSESWLHCFLRRGLADVSLADAAFRVVPIFKSDSDSVCAGFAFEGATPEGQTVRREFGSRALGVVSQRASDRLIKFGVLQPGDRYRLELVVDAKPHRRAMDLTESAEPPQPNPPKVTVKSPPLNFLSLPLRPLLKEGRAVGELDEDAFHVFYTEGALGAAERYSRKGTQVSGGVETGAALAGFLCLASDTTDFFVIVTDVLEAVSAENTEFSLTYSSESWTRISRIMSARQSAQRACRLCGSAHGHNFSPGEPCASCFNTSQPCGTHNVFPSVSDHVWTRSVFAHQPWALCHIFGANARGEALAGLFTFRWGSLARRGFLVLPDFVPGKWGTVSASNPNSK
jgi:hypothetical protein